MTHELHSSHDTNTDEQTEVSIDDSHLVQQFIPFAPVLSGPLTTEQVAHAHARGLKFARAIPLVYM